MRMVRFRGVKKSFPGENMKRTLLILTATTATALCIGLLSASAEPKHETSAGVPECPVMGEPANLFVKTDTKSGPVYFCCRDCVEKYTANPAKYAKKAEAQRKAL